VIARVSADGSELDTAAGQTFSISDRGEFRERVLDWIRGDDVRVCRRIVNGESNHTVAHRSTRVQASLLRGKP